MRVGIVTWYGVTNYGSALQAYAMQRIVESAGHECHILRHPVHEHLEQGARLTRVVGGLTRVRKLMPGRVQGRLGESEKIRMIADFRAEHLNVTNTYIDKCEVDLAIIGSDQIFDIRSYHQLQFGIGVNANEIATYAPSFGETSPKDLQQAEHRAAIQEAVSRMTLLSARDENTKAVIASVDDRSAQLVLDPTLMYDFSDEQKTWMAPPPFDRYVVIYTWGGPTTSKEFAVSVRMFAKKQGLKTVSIGDNRPWCDLNLPSASPIEFFSLISQATVVVTNMFHGTCFALRAKVPVLPIVSPHNVNKLGDLLIRASMDTWRLDSIDTIADDPIPEVDWVSVENALHAERQASKAYLSELLSTGNDPNARTLRTGSGKEQPE